MDMNNFLQSEATQFVGTAAANTIGLVIGNEGSGVSRLVREKCDMTASIPMKVSRNFLRFPMNIRPSVLYLPEPELSHRRLRLMTQ